MTDHNLFYYPYASFTNAQLPLLKVAVVWFDKLVILDPVGAGWDTVGADHIARDRGAGSGVGCGHPGGRMAVRLARRQEDGPGKRFALFIENINLRAACPPAKGGSR